MSFGAAFVCKLITRVDDELHARLKAKAEAEGRSMNDLITFEPEREPVGLDELERRSAGWGPSVSEALDWSRGEW